MSKISPFKAWMKERMKSRGYTQLTLGKRLGLEQSAISRIVNGRQGLRVTEAVALSDLFDTPVRDVCELYVSQKGWKK